MNKIIIQIYEIQEPGEAEKLINTGVDHVGSVLISEKDWKQPAIRDTINAVKKAEAGSSLIPLFNNPDSVFRALDYYAPDIVHFCEDIIDIKEARGTCRDLIQLHENIRLKFPEIRIMRTLPIPPAGHIDPVPLFKAARLFEPVSDYFLTDTRLTDGSGPSMENQQVNEFIGITGQTCDWDIARRLVDSSKIPVILAGGIGPENVFDGITRVCPAGIDSCTGTNVLDNQGRPIRFKKDIEKVKHLVKEVRRAEGMDSE